MGKPRLSAEARIMALYEGLSAEGKRIVFELLKIQQPSTRKVPSKKGAKPIKPAEVAIDDNA